jgi:hypothetical protein
MDCNRPYNKTKYTTCRVFCTFHPHRPISASIIFNASNTSVNFFPNDKPKKIGHYKYGERLFKCDPLSQSIIYGRVIKTRHLQ